jgi:acetyltransferase-like isoleucine patch superfamily enzyme
MKQFNFSKVERLILKAVPEIILRVVIPRIKGFEFFKRTLDTQTPISFKMWYDQMIGGNGNSVYWPIHRTSHVGNAENIYCGIETCPGFSPGNYIQGIGKVYIGDYTQIGPNVGIISANHDLYDNRKHLPAHVKIGKYCWIGMGAIILPGVELGDFTIVGAGSVVTKSYLDGYAVIAGNPARVVKVLDKNKCIRHRSQSEYNGYVPSENFEKFRKSYLNV